MMLYLVSTLPHIRLTISHLPLLPFRLYFFCFVLLIVSVKSQGGNDSILFIFIFPAIYSVV